MSLAVKARHNRIIALTFARFRVSTPRPTHNVFYMGGRG